MAGKISLETSLNGTSVTVGSGHLSPDSPDASFAFWVLRNAFLSFRFVNIYTAFAHIEETMFLAASTFDLKQNDKLKIINDYFITINQGGHQ